MSLSPESNLLIFPRSGNRTSRIQDTSAWAEYRGNRTGLLDISATSRTYRIKKHPLFTGNLLPNPLDDLSGDVFNMMAIFKYARSKDPEIRGEHREMIEVLTSDYFKKLPTT